MGRQRLVSCRVDVAVDVALEFQIHEASGSAMTDDRRRPLTRGSKQGDAH